MNKEQFLYKYLVKYNYQEGVMKAETRTDNATHGWESYDKKHDTCGMIFYALRNKLAHDTERTINELAENFINFDDILNSQDCLKLNKEQKILYIEFLITSSNLKEELLEKSNYSLYVNDSEKNPYRCYAKVTESGLRINIFFHHRAKFISADVSTYNHNVEKGKKEFYKDTDIYIETEFYNNTIGCRMFIDEGGPIPTRLDLTYEFTRNTNSKYLIESNWIGYSTMEEGIYTNFYNRGNDTKRLLTYSDLIKKIESSFNVEIIDEICKEVKSLYNEARSKVKKVGMIL